MSRRAQCWNNTVAKSFWVTMKRETLPVKYRFNPKAGTQAQIQQWIFYYNGKCLHSRLGMIFPNEYLVSLLKAN